MKLLKSLNKNFLIELFVQGGLIAVCAMIAFHMGMLQGDNVLASTMAFTTLTMARLFHGFNCRSEQSIFKIGFRSNIASVAAFVVGIALLLLVLFVPFLGRLFEVSPMNAEQVGVSFLLAFIPTFVIQLGRVIRKK